MLTYAKTMRPWFLICVIDALSRDDYYKSLAHSVNFYFTDESEPSLVSARGLSIQLSTESSLLLKAQHLPNYAYAYPIRNPQVSIDFLEHAHLRQAGS